MSVLIVKTEFGYYQQIFFSWDVTNYALILRLVLVCLIIIF